LPRIVAAAKPGTTVSLEVWRNGSKRQIDATLGDFQPEKTAQRQTSEPPRNTGGLGLTVRELPPAQRKALGVDFGLVVEAAQGAAQAAKVQRGDVILAINNMYFRSIEEFNKIVQQQPSDGIVALLIRRGDAALYVPVRLASESTRR
jgi:serine protease Do